LPGFHCLLGQGALWLPGFHCHKLHRTPALISRSFAKLNCRMRMSVQSSLRSVTCCLACCLHVPSAMQPCVCTCATSMHHYLHAVQVHYGVPEGSYATDPDGVARYDMWRCHAVPRNKCGCHVAALLPACDIVIVICSSATVRVQNA
jgi:hypothetical protein